MRLEWGGSRSRICVLKFIFRFHSNALRGLGLRGGRRCGRGAEAALCAPTARAAAGPVLLSERGARVGSGGRPGALGELSGQDGPPAASFPQRPENSTSGGDRGRFRHSGASLLGPGAGVARRRRRAGGVHAHALQTPTVRSRAAAERHGADFSGKRGRAEARGIANAEGAPGIVRAARSRSERVQDGRDAGVARGGGARRPDLAVFRRFWNRVE